MASKYELSISTDYVPDWTYVEAIREIFQNALDNEIANPENKMGFDYDEENQRLTVSNKTSVLNPESLLLGSSTKRDDKDTIGKHGEGYKIAFMVLLREGKDIKVYNYGAREIWETRLVKAKRYNNRLVPTIFINKQAIWNKVPNSDLTITIDNITPEEYSELVNKNLHLRDNVNYFEVPENGRILIDKEEKGNIYVKGLFVCKNKDIEYGYDFEPTLIELDRDRKLVDTFNIAWQSSAMWRYAFAKDFKRDEMIRMIKEGKEDTKYIKQRTWTFNSGIVEGNTVEELLADELAKDFLENHGENSIPVKDNRELTLVNQSKAKPVLVNEVVSEYIRQSTAVRVMEVPQEETLREQFQKLLDDIESKLTDEEVERFTQLINKLD